MDELLDHVTVEVVTTPTGWEEIRDLAANSSSHIRVGDTSPIDVVTALNFPVDLETTKLALETGLVVIKIGVASLAFIRGLKLIKNVTIRDDKSGKILKDDDLEKASNIAKS